MGLVAPLLLHLFVLLHPTSACWQAFQQSLGLLQDSRAALNAMHVEGSTEKDQRCKAHQSVQQQ